MKILHRNIVHGYFLTNPDTPEDPERHKILHGVKYNQAHDCGQVIWQGEQKVLVCIPFSPDLYPDTKGQFQESFELSGVGADKAYEELVPRFSSAIPDLSQFAPSGREKVLASIADGLSVFDAFMTHIARLLPEYCGATFTEVIEFRPELLVQTVDEETESVTFNIQRCSLE